MGTLGLGVAGLGTVGNLWTAYQGNQLAKKQFSFARDTTNTNLRNQTQSYNNRVEDRLTARGVAQGNSPEEIRAQIARYSLPSR
jgi:hypothetical protein